MSISKRKPPITGLANLQQLLPGLRCRALTAVREGSHEISYDELVERAAAVAATLRDCGAGPGCVVPIQAAPSIEAVIVVVGVMLTGAAFAPIDVRVPPVTVARMARLCGSPFCVATTGPPIDGVTRVPLDDLTWLDETRPTVTPTVPDDTTYLIFTSGTSGTPKGVVVPREAVATYLGWSMLEYALDAGYGAPLLTSLGFDLTITSLLGPLAGGRRIEVLDRLRWPVQVAAQPELFEAASFVKLTPSQVSLLCDVLNQQQQTCAVPRLVVGGEALFSQVVAQWRDSLPGVIVTNEYGPSEATVGCCRAVVPDDARTDEVPIGMAAPGTMLEVVPIDPGNEAGNALKTKDLDVMGDASSPIDEEEGELLIAGPQVALGYLQADDAAGLGTPGNLSPFSVGPHGRRYASGDRVRRLSDGTFVYLGRLGREVKINGFRVNLAALESRLAAYPGVVNAAVQLGGKELHAVVSTRLAATTSAVLLAHLREVFPSYALPTELKVVRDVRTTERGKFTMEVS